MYYLFDLEWYTNFNKEEKMINKLNKAEAIKYLLCNGSNTENWNKMVCNFLLFWEKNLEENSSYLLLTYFDNGF